MTDLFYQQEASIFMQQMNTSMAQHLELTHGYQPFNTQSINQLVELEMKRLRDTYANEEEHYVEQMLRENPVVVERRQCSTPRGSSITSSNTSDESRQTPNAGANRVSSSDSAHLAESCRKSRINGKIKKAKAKFRHKFVAAKLAQSDNVLKCIREAIVQTENKLLRRGYRQDTLQKLRNTFGLTNFETTAAKAITQ